MRTFTAPPYLNAGAEAQTILHLAARPAADKPKGVDWLWQGSLMRSKTERELATAKDIAPNVSDRGANP